MVDKFEFDFLMNTEIKDFFSIYFKGLKELIDRFRTNFLKKKTVLFRITW